MANGKRLIVLAGSGHKGLVKLTTLAGSAKGSCSLDFRPTGATLYLVGNKIAGVPIDDIESTFDLPFQEADKIGCLLRSSSVTMFGGDMSRGDIIAKVDAHVKASKVPERQNPVYAERISRSERSNSREDRKIPQEADKKSPSRLGENDIPSSPRQDAANDAPADAQKEERNERDASKPLYAHAAESLQDWTRFDGNNFYYAVKPQLDEMFVCYPKEERLSTAVQNSKWVRVDAADGEYAVGVLFDGDTPAFICYAVPEYQNNRRPPREIEDMCVWLPVSEAPLVGYWVIYQSARTGEIIK